MLNKLRGKAKKTSDLSQEEPKKRRLTRAMSKGGGSSSRQAPPSSPSPPQEEERELTWGEQFVRNNRGYMAPISEKFFRDVNRDRYIKLKSLKIKQEKGFKDDLREVPAIYGDLERRGWLRFNELMERGKNKANLEIVREFFANVFQGDVNRKVYVRGVLVDYSGEAINRLLRTARVQECTYMPLQNVCSSMPIRERKEIRSFVGRPLAPWYKYYGGSAPTKIHIHHFNPIGRAWAEWVMHNIALVANITEIQLPNALLVKMIMDQSDIDLGALLSMDIKKIARVERPSVRLGHCNLIYALNKARGVPELVEDQEILPVAPLSLAYFRTFQSSHVPEEEREKFVEEEDPDKDHEGDDVDDYLNANENANDGGEQEEDELMAEIDGFEGAPQGGFHYTHHEDELARMLHELDLYKATGASHIYYNQQGSLYQEAMRYREEHPPPSDYELYPTRGEWEAFLHDDRVRYDGVMGRRSREWERNYMAHHPPASPHGGPSYAPYADFGVSQEYGVGVENPNLSFDVTDFGLRYDHEGNCNSPGPTNLGGPGTATSRSSPPPSLVEFLPSVGIEPCTLGFKYMFNPFPLPLNWVHGSIPTEGKNSTREGGGEGREVTHRDHLSWWGLGCYTM
ncbi:hypothetical protein TSUD_125530 [Trifolium subterraneum]|uniref:Putative plant transposon protein domain-containing protein n=1 Tax=Trifolium subterraneum TaxID=3900 RepID=A0A2Z6MQ05_TRISU|nr:hypothetical protein TSUD_125530 [Trifolium subterraneum]